MLLLPQRWMPWMGWGLFTVVAVWGAIVWLCEPEGCRVRPSLDLDFEMESELIDVETMINVSLEEVRQQMTPEDVKELTDGELSLPFSREDDWWVMTRGYKNSSHRDYGTPWVDDRYALDFAQNGCEPWRKPVHPIRPGVVEESRYSAFGYGNMVVINHGEGYKSRYAHLDERLVEVGQWVNRDEMIGLTGNTGNVFGSACPEHPGTHLHIAYYFEGDGVMPEPMSGHVNFRVGCEYGHDGAGNC